MIERMNLKQGEAENPSKGGRNNPGEGRLAITNTIQTSITVTWR
jgi:hypothetical protein